MTDLVVTVPAPATAAFRKILWFYDDAGKARCTSEKTRRRHLRNAVKMMTARQLCALITDAERHWGERKSYSLKTSLKIALVTELLRKTGSFRKTLRIVISPGGRSFFFGDGYWLFDLFFESSLHRTLDKMPVPQRFREIEAVLAEMPGSSQARVRRLEAVKYMLASIRPKTSAARLLDHAYLTDDQINSGGHPEFDGSESCFREVRRVVRTIRRLMRA